MMDEDSLVARRRPHGKTCGTPGSLAGWPQADQVEVETAFEAAYDVCPEIA